MSKTSSIVVWNEPPNVVESYVRLIHRLLARGEVLSAHITRYKCHDASVSDEVIDIAIWKTREELAQTAEGILNSEMRLRIDLSVPLSHSRFRVLPVVATLFGRDYAFGAPIKAYGHIYLSCSHGELADWSPLWQETWQRETGLNAIIRGDASIHAKQMAVLARAAGEEAIRQEAIDFFLCVCGREGTEHDVTIRYAEMRAENASPLLELVMILHPDIHEVGRDVARLYATKEWGVPTIAMQSPGCDILALDDKYPDMREAAWGMHAEHIRQCLQNSAERSIHEFFTTLSREDAERCMSLTVSSLELIIDEAVREDIVETRQFPDGAVALLTHPRLNLGAFYRYLIETTRPGGRHAWLAK